MKRYLFCLLSLMVLMTNESFAKAQDNGTQWILPLGSTEGWNMKYIMCNKEDDAPSNDTNGNSWIDLNYDDSSWQTLTGPIGSEGIENLTPNFNIVGFDNFFFLRRKFTISGELADVYCLKIIYDDFVRVYLNGELIIDNNCSTLYIPGSSFVQGENILSICYKGFGYPDYLDYGLYENVDNVIQEDGTFTTITQNGVRMVFKVINEEKKTVQVGMDRGPAIEKRTAGEMSIPSIVNGYNVVKIGQNAFSGCSNITSVLIPEGVTEICTRGFSGCNNLKTITLPSTLSVLGDVVFEGCGALDNVALPVGIETIPWGLFFDCRSLSQIEIPNTVTSIHCYAFENCDNLKSVIIPNSVRSIGGMSFRANTLESVICYIEDPFEIEDGTFYGWGTHTNATLYVPVGTLEKYQNTAGWEQFLNIVELEEVNPENCEPYAVYKDGVLTFYYDDKKGTREGTVYGLNKGYNAPGWYNDHRTDITKAVFDDSFAGARPTSTDRWFTVRYNENETSNLTEIQGIQNLNTSNVTSMGSMFYGCSGLTSLDVSHFDTGNVTHMNDMFEGCSGLTSLDVSHFDTGNVTSMGSMFYGCSGLTSLDVSHFDTGNVTSMGSMFYGCSGLTSLDVSHFDTSNVTSMNGMFSGCSGLTSLDVSHFDTSNVTNMSSMFSHCRSLTSLDVSHFDTGKVTSMYHFFSGCSGLTSLDVSSFNTGNVTNMNYMFDDCSSLTILDVSHFDTSNVTNMEAMFYGCSGLTSLDLSHFDTSNVTRMDYMFSGCSGLTSLDLSHFDTGNVTSMSNMFRGCSNLSTIYCDDTWTCSYSTYMFYNCKSLPGYQSAHTNVDYAKPIDLGGYFTRVENNPNGIINFADVEVKRICVENWDTNGDGELSYGEAAAVTDLGEVFKNNKKIVSFNELQYFTSLDTLHSYAFAYCDNLEHIILPSSIKTIGRNCLQGCTKLCEIILPSNLETIENQAFDDCKNIKSLFIPSKVNKIDHQPIHGCMNIESIEIASDNQYYESPQNCNAIIDKKTKTLIAGCHKTIIPNDILNINNCAFSGINNLKNIILPKSLISIGNYAFEYCSSLQDISIPNGVKTIGIFAFLDCQEFTSLYIPSSVTSIGYAVTGTYSDKLRSIIVSEDNPNYDSRDNCNAIIATSSNKLIAGCETSIIPQTVTSIGNRAFLGRYGFKSIEIPGNIKTIEEYAYAACKNVETIILHKGIVSIADYVFNSINSLKEVYSYSNEPISIQKSTFGGKESNVTLYVPYGCKAAYEAADYWKEFKEIIEMDGDNSLYADNVTVRPGVQKTVTLQLDNENTFIAGEFRLQLPAGMRIETDEDGDPVANIVSGRSNKHTLMVTDEGNGLYHFLLYSGQNRAILGNSGDFISMSVIADEELDDGSYTAKLKNVFFSTEDEKRIDLPDVDFNINVLDYTPGDVNGDGSLNVMDVVKLVNYIMGRNPSDFVFVAADMDENGKINVMDLVNVVEVIMAAPQQAPVMGMATSSNLELGRMDKNTVSLSVPDANRHIAAQFVVTLSGNAVLKDVLSDDAHQSEVTRMADGRYKVMVYSGRNDLFRSDCPISLQLSGNSDVKIDDVVFVDADEEAVAYEPATTHATGILSVGAEFSQPTDIYTVNGSLVKKGATSMRGLASGVYIVNNEKVVIK